MKTIKEQIQIMQAFEDGKTIIRTYKIGSGKDEINNKCRFFYFDFVNYDYDIKKLQFPAPPEGEEWHNPDNLTPEFVEIDKGYRLLLKSEISYKDNGSHYLYHNCSCCLSYKDGPKKWGSDNYNGESQTLSYRTLLRLPKKKVLVKKFVNFKNYNHSSLWIKNHSDNKDLVIHISKCGNFLIFRNNQSFSISALSEGGNQWAPTPNGDWQDFHTMVEE